MAYEMIVVENRMPGHPYAAPPDEPLEAPGARALSGLVPLVFAVRHNMVPLSLDGDVLTVAMADPADAVTLRRLRLITRCHIQPLSATRAQVRAAIVRAYRDE